MICAVDHFTEPESAPPIPETPEGPLVPGIPQIDASEPLPPVLEEAIVEADSEIPLDETEPSISSPLESAASSGEVGAEEAAQVETTIDEVPVSTDAGDVSRDAPAPSIPSHPPPPPPPPPPLAPDEELPACQPVLCPLPPPLPPPPPPPPPPAELESEPATAGVDENSECQQTLQEPPKSPTEKFVHFASDTKAPDLGKKKSDKWKPKIFGKGKPNAFIRIREPASSAPQPTSAKEDKNVVKKLAPVGIIKKTERPSSIHSVSSSEKSPTKDESPSSTEKKPSAEGEDEDGKKPRRRKRKKRSSSSPHEDEPAVDNEDSNLESLEASPAVTSTESLGQISVDEEVAPPSSLPSSEPADGTDEVRSCESAPEEEEAAETVSSNDQDSMASSGDTLELAVESESPPSPKAESNDSNQDSPAAEVPSLNDAEAATVSETLVEDINQMQPGVDAERIAAEDSQEVETAPAVEDTSAITEELPTEAISTPEVFVGSDIPTPSDNSTAAQSDASSVEGNAMAESSSSFEEEAQESSAQVEMVAGVHEHLTPEAGLDADDNGTTGAEDPADAPKDDKDDMTSMQESKSEETSAMAHESPQTLGESALADVADAPVTNVVSHEGDQDMLAQDSNQGTCSDPDAGPVTPGTASDPEQKKPV